MKWFIPSLGHAVEAAVLKVKIKDSLIEMALVFVTY
jgi:hypothetical protein